MIDKPFKTVTAHTGKFTFDETLCKEKVGRKYEPLEISDVNKQVTLCWSLAARTNRYSSKLIMKTNWHRFRANDR